MSETSGRVVSKTVIWGPGRASGQVVPVRDLYEVFRRARGDAQAERAARADGYCDRFEDKTGLPRYADARLVSGTAARGVYAVPTSRELVCVGAFPGGAGGSLAPGEHGLTIEWDSGDQGAASLYGLVGDDVRGVDVVVGGKTLQAALGENAYALPTDRQPTGLVLHLSNGETDEISFP